MQNSIRIGGSDIPTLLGINPFKDLYTLLLEKCKFKEVNFEDTEYTEYGKIIEPLIRDYLNQEVFKDDPITTEDYWENEAGFVSKVDGKNSSTIVEIKSTSVVHNNVNDYMNYLCQLLFYIWRYDLRDNCSYKGKLVVYNRPKDFREQLKNKNVVFNKDLLQIFDIDFSAYSMVLENIKVAINNFDYYVDCLMKNPFLKESELFGSISTIE